MFRWNKAYIQGVDDGMDQVRQMTDQEIIKNPKIDSWELTLSMCRILSELMEIEEKREIERTK